MDQIANPKRSFNLGRWVRPAIGVLFLAFLAWRLWIVLFIQRTYGPETWVRFAISGLILGGVYAVIALGYTLIYGILFMINFAHGDFMMLGAFAGYFTLEAFNGAGLLNRSFGWATISILAAFVAGVIASVVVAVATERLAYRPLRAAPRLVPLISAIGASYFLWNAAQILFGSRRFAYTNPEVIKRGIGWTLMVGGEGVLIPYTGVFTFGFSLLLMLGLRTLVQRTRLGRAMRAVAEDKEIAALMGIDVDRVISSTFAISGVLAGAAGVMWGLHMGNIYFYVGFIPGIKAFTAAVLGGVGNIAGAMVGGLVLGILEAVAPAALGMPFQLKDVLAFAILVLALIFRPTGLLGEILSEKKM